MANTSISDLSRPKLKIQVISRSKLEYTRQSDKDIHKIHRNVDPKLHPFEKAREYTRALNAVKLDKIFAKPFVFALDEHRDSIYCLNTLPTSLISLLSGACDGELKVWNLAFRKCVWSAKAHAGFVRGVVGSDCGTHVLSCGDDKTIKLWSASPASQEDGVSSTQQQPIRTFLGNHAYTGIDWQHIKDATSFATAGVVLDLWDIERSEPVHSFSWGADSVTCLRFNPIEQQVLLSAASDRNLVLYDVRTRSPIRKLIMQMNTNAIAWNPMEAFNFTIGNEDHNCYTFDMRKLKSALNVHVDHVSAVMSLDYSPTGQEFVTGGYDRTVRIFPANAGHSREVYHSKRMQRIFAVKFSADNKYVISGSDDTNIRLWKAQASMPIKPLVPRERAKMNYLGKLKERFKNAPDIQRITRHRHLPKAIYNAQKLKTVVKQAQDIKVQRVRAHSKPGSVPFVAERKKHILRELE